MSSRLHSGLVSVTFRKLSSSEIVNLCVQAKLEGIEWGGDIHVPAGDLQRAKETRQLTLEHGLNVAAYGSYYRLGIRTSSFESVLETAQALGAPTIRVWAGTVGSREADEVHWQAIVRDGMKIADQAQAVGLSISFEFHPDTLTDTLCSALRLLREIDRSNVRSYWQVGPDEMPTQSAESLSALLPWLTNVHVFHWQPTYKRQPLESGRDAWLAYLKILHSSQRDLFLMLEFVQADSPEAFLRDAQVLKHWLAETK